VPCAPNFSGTNLPVFAIPILSNGLLPNRASLMLDLLFIALFVIVLILAVSIYLVRVKKNYLAHKWIQINLAMVLLVALVAFELDIRFFSNWRELAEASPYFQSGLVQRMLAVHLMFAIPTPFLWAWVIWRALRRFPRDPKPGPHSREHRFWGRLAAIFMLLTSVTGWVFYWMAFVA
jgi:uncharacterized membrane protein YozB (DUF420 family)